MNSIKLITAPDKLYNNTYSILTIFPSTDIKEQLQTVLLKSYDNINLYLYENTKDSADPEWLMDVFSMCDICIMDIDNIVSDLKPIQGYFLAFDKTYWLTNGENPYYNKLNSNRIYNFEIIDNIINGDNFV